MKRNQMLAALAAVLFLLSLSTACFASLVEEMKVIDSYVQQYRDNEIDAAKLIVYIDYTKSRLYESLGKEGKSSFEAGEIAAVFGSAVQQYIEKEYNLGDFDVVFSAKQFYRHDREYYESRDDETVYYTIDYAIRPAAGAATGDSRAKTAIKEFIADLRDFAEEHETINDYDEIKDLQQAFGQLKSTVSAVSAKADCEALMSEVLEENGDYFGPYEAFGLKIQNSTREDCWEENECENVCETSNNCWDDCREEVVCTGGECAEECHTETFFNETSGQNETIEACEEVCSQEECRPEQVCERRCDETENCNNECEPVERCTEYLDGELAIEAFCNDGWSEIRITASGPLNKYSSLNDATLKDGMACPVNIGSLVKMRAAFQDSVDTDFLKWYFEEFLGDDPEKLINGGNGLRKVIELIVKIEEDISTNIYCTDGQVWPDGFEKIDAIYSDGSTSVEIWEKSIPVEGAPNNGKYWTTLYKYSWVPDKDLIKKLIDYKMNELNSIGPSAEEIAMIRADEGRMEIVSRIANKYGGSLDIKLELAEEGKPVILKYLQVNEKDILKLSDSIEEKEDISITVDFSILYDFITYMEYTVQGNEIKGPYWVYVQDDDGFGKVMGVIGAISKMWREGFKISPRPAIYKLLTSTGDMLRLMAQTQSQAAGKDYGSAGQSDYKKE